MGREIISFLKPISYTHISELEKGHKYLSDSVLEKNSNT